MLFNKDVNWRREEQEIMRVGTQLSVCDPLHYLCSLLIPWQNVADDIGPWTRLREEDLRDNDRTGCFLSNLHVLSTTLASRCYCQFFRNITVVTVLQWLLWSVNTV